MTVDFPKGVKTLASALSVVAGLLILVVGGLTVADVLSRNLRGQSILGVLEISSLVLVAVAFLGLTAAEIKGQHVSVSLVEERLGQTQRLVLSFFRGMLLTLLGVVLVIGMFFVLESAIFREETTNDILRLPTWPAKLIVLISYALFFLIAVWKEAKVFKVLKHHRNAFSETVTMSQAPVRESEGTNEL